MFSIFDGENSFCSFNFHFPGSVASCFKYLLSCVLSATCCHICISGISCSFTMGFQSVLYTSMALINSVSVKFSFFEKLAVSGTFVSQAITSQAVAHPGSGGCSCFSSDQKPWFRETQVAEFPQLQYSHQYKTKQMNIFLIYVCLFHVKHYVRLLFPCLPKGFGTFFPLVEQYLHSFQDLECSDNVCAKSGHLYLIGI